MKSTVLLSLAALAVAQPPRHWSGSWGGKHTPSSSVPAPPAYTSGVPSNQAPSSAGLKNATTGLSRGGQAVCVDGYVSVSAQTAKNVKFDFDLPANEFVC